MEANYARLLPGDLFGQIEKQSLAITPIVIHQQETGKKAKNTRTALSSTAGKKPVAPVAVKEVKSVSRLQQLRLSLKQRLQLPLLPFKP